LAPWLAPLLKFGFTLSYVLLAPVIGPLADAMPKARLMAWMNGLKVLGVAALLAGCTRWPAFTLVGLGAAAYAPAKYGLITEIVPRRQLVAANGWIEVSVVCAVLLGTVLRRPAGQPLVAGGAPAAPRWPAGMGAGALQVLAAAVPCWRCTAGRAAQPGVPDSGARYPRGACTRAAC
jgi:LPLT family lysophospholipid transporter-like MFS transporter